MATTPTPAPSSTVEDRVKALEDLIMKHENSLINILKKHEKYGLQ